MTKKYPELAKRTPEYHPDFSNISAAWEAMGSLATTVNEKMATANMQTALFAAYETTSGCPVNLISSKRRCVFDIDAIEKTSNRPVHIFLCSDLLMIAHHLKEKSVFSNFGKSSGENQTQQYKFLRWIDLMEISLEELPSTLFFFYDFFFGNSS
jgi:hypothetical protein